MQFRGVREAIYWYFNESDKSPDGTSTGQLCRFTQLFRAGETGWVTFDTGRLKAPATCENCMLPMQTGERFYRYPWSERGVVKVICATCRKALTDGFKNMPKCHNRFQIGPDFSDRINARIDIERLIAQRQRWEHIILAESSQIGRKQWARLFINLRRCDRKFYGKCNENLRRTIHRVLCDFENTLRAAGYIHGAGEYGKAA